MKPSTTIADLKRKIEDKTGAPIATHNLTLRGKFLNGKSTLMNISLASRFKLDEYNVATYDIYKHSTICMTIRPRGNE